MHTSFYFERPFNLKERKRLKMFIASIFMSEHKRANSLNYIFCSDDYLLNINKQFLQHDYYTDIITFNLSESSDFITGEIYISIDRLWENSILHSTSLKEELHRVMFHGVLHLCGYKDKTKKQQAEMRDKENYYLKKFG